MKCNDGHALPLNIEETQNRLDNLDKLSLADLFALEQECESKNDYHNRRFPKNRKENRELYEMEYSHFIWWFTLGTEVRFTINNRINNLSNK